MKIGDYGLWSWAVAGGVGGGGWVVMIGDYGLWSWAAATTNLPLDAEAVALYL